MGDAIVYPRPQWLQERPGQQFVLTADMPVVATPGARAEAAHLQRWLAQDYGLTLGIGPAGAAPGGLIIGLLGDEEIRRLLRERGIQQVKKFSWARSVERALEIYRQAAAEPLKA